MNVSVLMELVMKESMEMDHVCVIMAGREHFVMNLQIFKTVFPKNAAHMPHAGVLLEMGHVSAMLVTQEMELTAQLLTPAL